MNHHRTVGFGYLAISTAAVILGSLLSLAMRLHLTWPTWPLPLHGQILPEEYLALVTMHGTLMLFFVLTVAPQSGFGNLILPAQIGSNRMAFPRLNAIAMYLTAISLFPPARPSVAGQPTLHSPPRPSPAPARAPAWTAGLPASPSSR
jgi:cytochrome c oxidase subunit 1